MTIVLHVRSASALAANLFVATGEDSGDFAADFETAGSVELVKENDDA